MSKKVMSQSVGNTVAELRDVSELVQSQVEAGMPREEVMESIFASWQHRLAALSGIPPGEKAQVTSALSSGPWSEGQRQELARAILVGSADDVHRKAKKRRTKSAASSRT